MAKLSGSSFVPNVVPLPWLSGIISVSGARAGHAGAGPVSAAAPNCWQMVVPTVIVVL